METIIIGIGNPLLTDDSVGIKVVRSLGKWARAKKDVVAREFCAGGIRLMEELIGYKKAVIIDAMVTRGGEPGAVSTLQLSELMKTRNTYSTHDASLAEALELGKLLGLQLPDDIKIWAIEAGDVGTYSEGLTKKVQAAVPRVVQDVIRHLDGNSSLPTQEGR
ncbi:MAG TPA: hydrogenase maturation protease [Candidatus Sulfotelmatobacter sp.]|nr:hydrogenase maturation protease [Candidatus Sulfotelmatobacter sp.]